MKTLIVFIIVAIVQASIFVESIRAKPVKQNAGIEQLNKVLDQIYKLDENDVKQFLKEINNREPLEALKYIRKRGLKAEESTQTIIKYFRISQELVKREPDNPVIKYAYAFSLAIMKNRKEAIKVLHDMMKHHPKPPLSHFINFSLTANYCNSGQYVEAIAYGIQVAPFSDSIGPDFTKSLYIWLGDAYDNMKEYDKSIDAYKNAIKASPGYPYAYQNIGIVYQHLKDWDKAVENGLKAVSLQSYPTGHFSLGNAYSGRKDYYKAIDQYKLALELNTGFLVCRLRLGHAYMEIENYESAKAEFKKILNKKPGDVDAMAAMGWYYNMTRRYEQAVVYLERTLRYNSDFKFAKKQLQIARCAIENHTIDLVDFNNKYDRAHKLLVEAYAMMQKGQLKESNAIIKKSIKLNPYEPLGFTYLASNYYNVQDFKSAAIELEKAMALDPYNAETATNYACTLDKLGRIDEAYKIVRETSAKIPENTAFKKLLETIRSKSK